MKKIVVAIILLSGLLFNACGGGSGSSSAPPPPAPLPPPPTSVSGGFWYGTMSFDSGQITEEYFGLMTEDGQFQFLSEIMPFYFSGMAARNVDTLTGSGIGITSLVFLDGTAVTNFSMEATLVEQTSLIGSWSTAAGDAGTFEFFFDEDYEHASSLALLEGVWTAFDDSGNPNAVFTVDALGSFTAQNAAGCNTVGSFLLLDARYNLYGVSSTISSCPLAGQYSGLAALADITDTNSALVMSLDNGQRYLLAGLLK